MNTTLVRALYRETQEHIEKSVKISGWIRTLRASNAFGFIEVNDGSFFKNVQVVFDSNISNFKEVSKLPISSSISVIGKLVPTPDAKQPFEIQAEEVIIEGMSSADYPLQKKRHTFEYLRTIAHLRPRSNAFSAVFRVRSVAAYAIHKFFQDQNFVYVHTPLITGSDCEGAGEMFRLTTMDLNNIPKTEDGKIDFKEDFFGKETNLTVSGQLNGESYALAFRNIYTFGPTFRAENSNTARHAAEFWMIEPEISFANLEDDMELAEQMLKYVIKYVMDECPEEMEFFNQFVDKGLKERLEHILSSEFGKVTYTEAVELLKNSGKTFKRPVFVTNYPKEIKAFYMRLNEDGKTVAAMDCLVPGIGEIIGGSQREERLSMLEARLEELGLNKEDYWWYLELRKYGETVHSGFGLGFERLIMYITGMSNIRDVIPFPRTTGQCDF
jgi:asparaginyl-tRNA synthetase